MLLQPRPCPRLLSHHWSQSREFSSFLDPGDLLGISQRVFPIEQAKRILWHDGPQLFMRVIPDVLVGPYPALAILKMLEGSRLVPFGCQGSVSHSMGNEWGAVTVTSRDTEAASPHHITQVTEHGEIWGNRQLPPFRPTARFRLSKTTMRMPYQAFFGLQKNNLV